jgi:hypothetical protein
MIEVRVSDTYEGIGGIAHGGYLAGLLADHMEGPARVVLRRPPLLDQTLIIDDGASENGDGTLRLRDAEGAVIMEAAPAEALRSTTLPTITLDEARARPDALATYEHPYPNCFVCGTARPDGLGVRCSSPDGAHVVAGVWMPSGPLLSGHDTVPRPLLWAVADCLTAWTFADRWADPLWWPAVTGQIAMSVTHDVPVGDPSVLVARLTGREGRRIILDAGIASTNGTVFAHGEAIWVSVPDSPGASPRSASAVSTNRPA